MIPDKYISVESAPVIRRHVIIGSTSVVLPSVDLAEGSSFGCFSFINKSSELWSINVGIPAKEIRSKNLLKYEKLFKEENNNDYNVN